MLDAKLDDAQISERLQANIIFDKSVIVLFIFAINVTSASYFC